MNKNSQNPTEQMQADTAQAHQEPVAWRVRPFDYGIGYEGVDALTTRKEQCEMWERKGWKVEPLYAAPQPPAQSCRTCTKTADLHKAYEPAPQQKPVAWLVCSTNPDGSLNVEHAATWKEAAHEHINDAIVEYEVSEAGSWIVQPAYTAPQPPAAQQEPVAWMYEWNGRTHITTADQRPIERAHPHFNKSKPLYTAPQPTENLRCKSTQKRLATLWGYVKPQHLQPLTEDEIYECERIAAIQHQRHKHSIRGQQITPADDLQWHFARAIEAAHGIGIKGGQHG